MQDEIDEFFDDPSNRNVATVDEVADLTGLSTSRVRAEARERKLRRAGATFIWGKEDVTDLVDDLQAADEDADEEEADEDAVDEDEDGDPEDDEFEE